MTSQILKQAEDRMKRSIESFTHEMGKIRTGRAHPSLIAKIRVDSYGSQVPIDQVATITIVDARTLSVSAWDKKNLPAIEKAITTSDLGLNPMSTGDGLRIPLPPLTEQRRKELIKVVKHESENAKVSIRNIRRDANQEGKDALKAKKITEDDERRLEEGVQKLTNKYTAEIDKIVTAKENELMAV